MRSIVTPKRRQPFENPRILRDEPIDTGSLELGSLLPGLDGPDVDGSPLRMGSLEDVDSGFAGGETRIGGARKRCLGDDVSGWMDRLAVVATSKFQSGLEVIPDERGDP